MALWGRQNERVETLKAEQFQVVDKQGRVRAVLGLAEGDRLPQVTFLNTEGVPQLQIGLNDEGPLVIMRTPAGHTGVRIAVSNDSGSVIMFCDEKEKPGAVIKVKSGRPQLTLLDADGKVRLALVADQSGSEVNLDDPSGVIRAQLLAKGKTSSGFKLSNAEGKDQVLLGLAEHTPVLTVYTAKGTSRIIACVEDKNDGSARLVLLDAKEQKGGLWLSSGEESAVEIRDAKGERIYRTP